MLPGPGAEGEGECHHDDDDDIDDDDDDGNQKCLETVKQQNPLKYSKNLVNSPASLTVFWERLED